MSTPLQKPDSCRFDFTRDESLLLPLIQAKTWVSTKYVRFSEARFPEIVNSSSPSCFACRDSNQKCDHQQPCSRCGSRYIACIYPEIYRERPVPSEKQVVIAEARNSIVRSEEQFQKTLKTNFQNCDHCRAIHQKCDRRQPCSTCITHDISCVYTKKQNGRLIGRSIPEHITPYISKFKIHKQPKSAVAQVAQNLNEATASSRLEPLLPEQLVDKPEGLPDPFAEIEIDDLIFDEPCTALQPPEQAAEIPEALPCAIEQVATKTSISNSRKKSLGNAQQLIIAANVHFLCKQNRRLQTYETLAQGMQISAKTLYRLRTAKGQNLPALNKLLKYYNVTYQDICSSEFQKTYPQTLR